MESVVKSSSEPPFFQTYKNLLITSTNKCPHTDIVEEREVPLIDLSRLSKNEEERKSCEMDIARASKEWGFFQVINHGISKDALERMMKEKIEIFRQPFEKKSKEDKFFNLSAGSYRWGTPTATCLKQLSWSEAFHIPMTDISGVNNKSHALSATMGQFAITVAGLAQKLAEILAVKLGHKSNFFQENCLPSTCYLRMNRYPPCSVPAEVFGLVPHTDSNFLTILHQDQVGGLQLVKDGKWIAVKPNPEALIINIGDLFQAWSNDVYKSVKHRVMANPWKERFSIAYFLCPSYETVIQSCSEPAIYKKFSFRQYRNKVQEDVKNYGYKVGLPRFYSDYYI